MSRQHLAPPVAKTADEWLRDFREVFSAEVKAAPLPLRDSEKLELVEKICAFANVDCRDPFVVKGKLGVSPELAGSNELFISLREDIRSLNLSSEVTDDLIDLAKRSDHIARQEMTQFRKRHAETGRSR